MENVGKPPPRSSLSLIGQEQRYERVSTVLRGWRVWDAAELIFFHGLLQVEAWVEYLLKRTEVRNPGAYLRRGLADGWPPADPFWDRDGS